MICPLASFCQSRAELFSSITDYFVCIIPETKTLRQSDLTCHIALHIIHLSHVHIWAQETSREESCIVRFQKWKTGRGSRLGFHQFWMVHHLVTLLSDFVIVAHLFREYWHIHFERSTIWHGVKFKFQQLRATYFHISSFIRTQTSGIFDQLLFTIEVNHLKAAKGLIYALFTTDVTDKWVQNLVIIFLWGVR